MGKPSFLTGEFSYAQYSGITTVAELLTAIQTELTALTGAWTVNGSGDYTSPADAHGRAVNVVITNPSGLYADFVVTDAAGRSLTNRRILIANPCVVDIYCSPNHLIVDCNTTIEVAVICIPDPDPMLAASCTQCYIALHATRNSSGTADGNVDEWDALDNDGSAGTFGIKLTPVMSGDKQLDAWGNYLFDPPELVCDDFNYMGTIPHCYLGPEIPAVYSEHTVPLGDGNTGVFRKLGLTNTSAGYDISLYARVS